MEDTANPQGSESPASDNIEAAFDEYLKRQANPAGDSDGEPPAEGAGDGQPASDAERAEQDAAEEQRFKVKVNGEEREVPLSELVKGYQMESDYRVKTSQVAEQARAAQAQAAQAQALQAHYAQQLQAYQAQLSQMQPAPPDPNLIQSDPVSFLQQQQAYQSWQQQMQAVQVEQQQLAQQRQMQQLQSHQAMLAQQAELLTKAIPDWADESKAKSEKANLAEYLTKLGFSRDEVNQVADHRAVVMARKAMLYDQLMTKQADATKKVATLPPKAPQRPGSGISPTDGRTRAMQSLKRSGSLDDAANAFAAMLSR